MLEDNEDDPSLDPDKVDETRLSTRTEVFNIAEEMEARLRKLDGPMSVSNALVPSEAYDIGDTDERVNPRACDLGYPEGYECAVESESGRVVMSDAPNWALAGDTYMNADEDDFIDDITEWA